MSPPLADFSALSDNHNSPDSGAKGQLKWSDPAPALCGRGGGFDSIGAGMCFFSDDGACYRGPGSR